LFFTAGLNGEIDGLFGTLVPIPVLRCRVPAKVPADSARTISAQKKWDGPPPVG
jgi:hypothetical protein